MARKAVAALDEDRVCPCQAEGEPLRPPAQPAPPAVRTPIRFLE
jgi:hypothetical protein